MFWNVDIKVEHEDTLCTKKFSVFAADVSDAETSAREQLAEDDPWLKKSSIANIKVSKINNLKEVHDLNCIIEGIKEAKSMGIDDDLIRAIYDLTKEGY